MQSVSPEQHGKPYTRLLVMTALSFASMYVLMYAMVDCIQNVYPSLNQFYMAALMTAPMIIFEMILMRSMYPNRKANLGVILTSALVLAASFLLIRNQVGISGREFLRSVIPHHSGALLMCRQADLADPELKQLCKTITAGQQAEIDQMTRILKDRPSS